MFKELIRNKEEYDLFCRTHTLKYTEEPESFPCLFIGGHRDGSGSQPDYTQGEWAYPSDFEPPAENG